METEEDKESIAYLVDVEKKEVIRLPNSNVPKGETIFIC
jgi:hypothetical protein